ncbi:hypothetical protein Tco_1349763 [Tanacetum coccineum]
MDDTYMTMEEYIKFKEEKARRRGRVFNWQTATYGKIRVDDDLYVLRFVEAEFLAIVIVDTVTPQDALPCKSQVSTPVNDEIDFRISFDESDDQHYTIIYDKNSFSYKMISVNDLKMDSENDNEKAEVPSFLPPKPATNMALPPHEQRHRFLRYEGLQYTDADIEDFESRLARIYIRGRCTGCRELVCSLAGLGGGCLILEAWISSAGDFLGTAPSYIMIRDPILRLCHRLIACSIARRSQAPEKLPIIDMDELVRLQICTQFDDTWAWVAMGPERQADVAAGAPDEDVPAVDEGDHAVLAPVQAPQQPPPPPPAAARTIPQRLKRLDEDVQGLRRDIRSLCGLVERSMTD